jgi:carboxyl-terminal processing protease
MKFKGLLFLLFVFGLTAQSQTIKKISQPEKDFETFWTTFKNNYAFFQLKGVNWDSSYTKFRPLISKKTTQKDLISVLGQMVEPLKDGHITISKGEEILYKVKKPSYFKQEFKGFEPAFWQTVYNTLENNNFSTVKGVGPVFKDENLYYVSKSSNVGYIRITRCFANPESIFDDKKELGDTKLMLKLFDSIIISLASTKSIIIDIRANGGGHGGIELASRFTNEKILTHYKTIRTKGNYESFTKLEANYLTPNNGTKYLNPIIILTNDKTASSAEDFTISLYQLKRVTTIGTNTSGMLSDMFSGNISSNISFTLSNQRYYTTDNKLLEDIGVPVKIEVKNTKQDIENKIDPVVIKAIQKTD